MAPSPTRTHIEFQTPLKGRGHRLAKRPRFFFWLPGSTAGPSTSGRKWAGHIGADFFPRCRRWFPSEVAFNESEDKAETPKLRTDNY